MGQALVCGQLVLVFCRLPSPGSCSADRSATRPTTKPTTRPGSRRPDRTHQAHETPPHCWVYRLSDSILRRSSTSACEAVLCCGWASYVNIPSAFHYSSHVAAESPAIHSELLSSFYRRDVNRRNRKPPTYVSRELPFKLDGDQSRSVKSTASPAMQSTADRSTYVHTYLGIHMNDQPCAKSHWTRCVKRILLNAARLSILIVAQSRRHSILIPTSRARHRLVCNKFANELRRAELLDSLSKFVPVSVQASVVPYQYRHQ